MCTKKGCTRTNGLPTSREFKPQWQSRHAMECMYTECEPDDKKKDKNWPMPPKIGEYFKTVPKSFCSMKSLIPPQRATQRGIAHRNQQTTQVLRDMGNSSGLPRTRGVKSENHVSWSNVVQGKENKGMANSSTKWL